MMTRRNTRVSRDPYPFPRNERMVIRTVWADLLDVLTTLVLVGFLAYELANALMSPAVRP